MFQEELNPLKFHTKNHKKALSLPKVQINPQTMAKTIHVSCEMVLGASHTFLLAIIRVTKSRIKIQLQQCIVRIHHWQDKQGTRTGSLAADTEVTDCLLGN